MLIRCIDGGYIHLALSDGINRRNLDILEPAIIAAKSSEIEYKLLDRIKEAEELRDHLLTLKRFAHDVLDLKQTTISELHRYSIPSPLILNVMKATFLLLGENPQNLEVHLANTNACSNSFFYHRLLLCLSNKFFLPFSSKLPDLSFSD